MAKRWCTHVFQWSASTSRRCSCCTGSHAAWYELPDFATWAKYVRSYERAVNGRSNTARGGRAGRSTVRRDEI